MRLNITITEAMRRKKSLSRLDFWFGPPYKWHLLGFHKFIRTITGLSSFKYHKKSVEKAAKGCV